MLTIITSGVQSATHERNPTGVNPPRPYKALPLTGDTTRASISEDGGIAFRVAYFPTRVGPSRRS